MKLVLSTKEKDKGRKEETLMLYHDGENCFEMWSMKEGTGSASKIGLYIKVILGIIAAVAFFVEGIGILNIILVSVPERIRESSIRKAVGTKSRDIRFQFYWALYSFQNFHVFSPSFGVSSASLTTCDNCDISNGFLINPTTPSSDNISLMVSC